MSKMKISSLFYHKMSDKSFSEQNENARKFFESHPSITSQNWSKSQLQGLKESENPFFSPSALNSGNIDHPAVSILSEQANEFVFQSIKYSPGEYDKQSEKTFRTEFND